MADQEGMPILHTLPPEKHSLPAKNVRIFHFTGTLSPARSSIFAHRGALPEGFCGRLTVQNSISMSIATLEPFVDATAAGEFLGLHPVTVQRLARSGVLPGHPVQKGKRQHWRFLLTELKEWLQERHGATSGHEN